MAPELERYCGQCGAKARSGIGFCESCGRPLGQAPEPAQDWSPPQAPSEAPVESPPPLVEWTSSFPLATSRFMLWDTLKVLVWSGLILYVILAGIALFTDNAGASFLGTAALMVGACVVGLGFLFFAVMLLYFGNRFTARFAVFREGVAYQSVSRRARLSNRAAIVVGVLAGSPQTAGAGFLAASRESGYYPWTDLRSVKEYPAHRVLSLCNSWRCVLRLYCSPENYQAVRDLVRAHLPAGAAWKEGAGRAATLLRGLLIGLAASLAVWDGSLSPWMAGGCFLLAVAGVLEGAAATLLAVLGCAGVAGEAIRIFAHVADLEWYRIVPALAGLLGAAALATSVLRRSRRAPQAAVMAVLLAVLFCAPLRAAQDKDTGSACKWGDIIAYAGGAGLLLSVLNYSRNDDSNFDNLGEFRGLVAVRKGRQP